MDEVAWLARQAGRSNQGGAMNRIDELIAMYGAGDACVADLLCDRHDPAAHRLPCDCARSLGAADLLWRIARESERFAAALQSLGIGPGDRVATLMGKSREYLVALMGIWRLGAVHVPLFTAFAPPAIALRLTGSGAKVVVCDAAAAAQAVHRAATCLPMRRGGSSPPAPAGDGAMAFDELIEPRAPGIARRRDGRRCAADPHLHLGHDRQSQGRGRADAGAGLVPCLCRIRLRPAGPTTCSGARPIRAGPMGSTSAILATFLTGTPEHPARRRLHAEATMAVLASEGVTNFAAAPTVYRALRARACCRRTACRCAALPARASR